MKTIMKKEMILGAMFCTFLMSCVTTYPTETLKSNYIQKMKGAKKAEIFKKYPLYFSESEVNGSFSVISINSWEPFVFPIFGSRKNKLKKHTLGKALSTTIDQMGDAAIIIDENHWKVIKKN